MPLVTVEAARALIATVDLGYWKQRDHDRCAVLVRAMRDGTFDPARGKPVYISRDGRLIDGRHRMMAIVLLGEPQILEIFDRRTG